MTYLIGALVAPVLGALLYRSLHRRDRAVRLVDGFVYVAVPALVALQVIPHSLEEGSPVILLLVAGGAIVPSLFERASHLLERYTDDLAILVGLSGLLLHEILEGAAFAPLGSPVDPVFGWAVILHRVPAGLIVWWLVRPRHGIPLAALAVGSLVVATLGGFLVGNELLGPVHGPGIERYQAFVSGTLLHVIFHRGRHDHTHDHAHTNDRDRGHEHRHELEHDDDDGGARPI